MPVVGRICLLLSAGCSATSFRAGRVRLRLRGRRFGQTQFAINAEQARIGVLGIAGRRLYSRGSIRCNVEKRNFSGKHAKNINLIMVNMPHGCVHSLFLFV